MNEPTSPTSNPYEPPKAELGGGPALEAATLDLPDASMGARFLNLVIDQLVRIASVYVLGYALGFILALSGAAGAARPAGVALSLVVFGLYYVVLESATGRTVGKLVTGTRVVTRDGRKPTVGQIIKRTLVRFIPFEPFSFLGSSLTGWHDRWSNTRVVRVRR
jgi:uncharacterized RDD family membrane protein YckC